MNVISLCLFGHSEMHMKSFPGCLLSYRRIFPDWRIHVYYDSTIQGHAIEGLFHALHDKKWFAAHEIARQADGKCLKMLWRLLPAWNELVGHFICRDVDSLALARDRRRVEAFVESGLCGHSTSDNIQHQYQGFLGGLCGFDGAQFRYRTQCTTWNELVSRAQWPADRWKHQGADQTFLTDHVWAKMKGSICQHRWNNEILDPDSPIIELAKVEDVGPYLQEFSDLVAEYAGKAGFTGDDFKKWIHFDKHPLNLELQEAINKEVKAREFLKAWDMA